MPLEKISFEEALALGIGEPSFIIYVPAKPKPQLSVPDEPLTQESERVSIKNTDSDGSRRDNG